MNHNQKRLEERFGVIIDKKSLSKLNLNIQGVDNSIPCMFLNKKSNRLSEWLILVNNKWTVCYYDKNRNSIVTFIENAKLNDFSLIERCIDKWMNKTISV